MDQRPPPLQEIAPIMRRAIAVSKRRRRGLLIARAVGDEIFPSDIHAYEGR